MNNTTPTRPDLWFGTAGSRNAKIAVVAESWGQEEAVYKTPLIGQSGKEFWRMMREAFPTLAPQLLDEALAARRFDEWVRLRNEWLLAADIFVTNVVAARPDNNEMWRFFYPNTRESKSPVPALNKLHPMKIIEDGLSILYTQLREVEPTVVLAAGNYALWALTNCTGYSSPQEAEGRRVPTGIESWRGSMWHTEFGAPGIKLIPIIHPAGIMRAWYWRAPTVSCDLAVRVHQALSNDWPNHPFTYKIPTFDEIIAKLDEWLLRADRGKFRLVNDIETRGGLITCTGLSDAEDYALVIPFVQIAGKHFDSYWSPKEEFAIVSRYRRLVCHPNVLLEGQNYLYDTQYHADLLGCTPVADFDTMLAQHLLFPGTPKGLDYISSLYCKHHWYWKDDGKEWDLKGGIETLVTYNAIDCMRQFESGTILRQLIKDMGQEPQWIETLERRDLALRMMQRGVLINRQHRAKLALDLTVASTEYANWFQRILPQFIVKDGADTQWQDSTKQQREFFSTELGLRLPKHRKTGRDTFGTEAIAILRDRHPEFTILFDRLEEYRSLEVFNNNFIAAPLDPDDRMRCSYNPAGTETFRFNSSKNAFNRGTNLQNIPKGDEE